MSAAVPFRVRMTMLMMVMLMTTVVMVMMMMTTETTFAMVMVMAMVFLKYLSLCVFEITVRFVAVMNVRIFNVKNHLRKGTFCPLFFEHENVEAKCVKFPINVY